MQLTVRDRAPDPFAPVIGMRLDVQESGMGRACGAQYRRRADILAATRRLLAEQGHEKFTLRAISDACGVTPQTIHNSFGNKAELLGTALNQHTVMIDASAVSRTRHPGVFLLLALAYCQTAAEQPEFMRQYMHTAFAPRRPLRDTLMKFGVNLKVRVLSRLAQENILRSSVDVRIAAEQIAYVNTFGLMEWAENDDLCQLHDRLVLGNGTLLLGILEPEAARGMETWLADGRNWRPEHMAYLDRVPQSLREPGNL